MQRILLYLPLHLLYRRIQFQLGCYYTMMKILALALEFQTFESLQMGGKDEYIRPQIGQRLTFKVMVMSLFRVEIKSPLMLLTAL